MRIECNNRVITYSVDLRQRVVAFVEAGGAKAEAARRFSVSEGSVMPFPLIVGKKSLVGGRDGSPSDTKEMLEFCAVHDVTPMCEQFAMNDINKAVQHVCDGKVHFRAVVKV
ncbi:MAG: IS630 transposase-related protein [Cyanobacteria bacterium P01_A01_bin.83]